MNSTSPFHHIRISLTWQVFDNTDRRMPIDKDEVRVRVALKINPEMKNIQWRDVSSDKPEMHRLFFASGQSVRTLAADVLRVKNWAKRR